MNFKSPLKKVITMIVWCALGGTGLALLIAAINTKNSSTCRGIEVEINGGSKPFFLNKREVTASLESQGLLTDLHNKKIASFDLLKMEMVLRKSSWVKDAQLYFDNNQVLKVRITERQPAARIFTVTGNSFLIDSAGVQMALPVKNVFRLPIFTGYPNERFGLRRDSAVSQQIRELAAFFNGNVFWSNQIQEINIRSGNFFMTPLLGDQIIEFGDGNDYEAKFHRLFVFYKSVITQTGFEKYSTIKLGYGNQVIATRGKGVISRADSIQAHKNVMEMIRMAREMTADTIRQREMKPLERNIITEQNLQSYDFPEEADSVTGANRNNKNKQ